MSGVRVGVITVCAAVSLLAVPTIAKAQAVPTGSVTVKIAAPIFLYPDAKRTPLVVARAGSVLRLLGEDGDFYNVEFRDPALGPRVGYIEKANVTAPRIDYSRVPAVDVSVEPPRPTEAVQSPPPNVQSPTTNPRIPQPRPQRQGFWFNAGLGFGSLGCRDCFGQRVNGPSGGLSLGGTISPRVLLGVGTTGWARSYLGETLTVGTLDARLRFYPSASSGFFITGGLGVGSVSFAGESEFGAAAVLGLGVDIRVGRKVSLTPFWNGFAMQSSSLDANVGQIGLGITVF